MMMDELTTSLYRNELSDLGFPPKMLYYYADDDTTTTTTNPPDEDYNALRAASLDLQGQVVLQIRSRPLGGKDLAYKIVFRLDTLRDLNQQVRQLSERNGKANAMRRGCTSDEIYDIYRAFFMTKVKDAIKFALQDIAQSKLDPNRESHLANQSKRIAGQAKESLLRYADSVESLSKEKIKQQLRITGEDGDVLLNEQELDRFVSDSLGTVRGSVQSMGKKALQQLSGMLRSATAEATTTANAGSSATGSDDDNDHDETTKPTPTPKVEMVILEDDFFFPDW